MDQNEIHDYIAKEKAFGATVLGKAFLRFKSAYARAWVMDTEDSYTDRDRASTKEAWTRAKETEQELRSLLESLANG